MFYHSVTISGFGPYETEVTFSFDAGVNVVTGKNGSGKSSIFDAIQWCLFGPNGSSRTLKDRTSVINLSSQKAKVVLELSSQKLGDIVITRSLTRSRSHNLVIETDGEKTTGVKKSQEKIDDLLGGLSGDSFSAMTMLISSPSVSVNEFITGNPTTRRQILADLADPRRYFEDRHKEVMKELREAKKQRDSAHGAFDVTASMLDEEREVKKPKGSLKKLEEKKDSLSLRLNNLSQSSSQWGRKALYLELERNRKLFDRLVLQQEKVLKRQDEVDEETAIAEEFEREYQHNIRRLKSRLRRARAEYDAGEVIVASCLDISHRLQREIDFYSQKQAGSLQHLVEESIAEGKCVLCQKPVNEGDLSHLVEDDDASNMIAKHRKYLLEIEHRLGFTRSRMDDLADVIDRAVDEIETLQRDSRRSVEELDDLYEDLEDELIGLEDEIAHTEEEVARLEEEIRELESQGGEDEVDESVIDEIREKLEVASSALSDFIVAQQQYEAYVARHKELLGRYDEAEETLNYHQGVVDRLEKEKFETSTRGKIAVKINEIMDQIAHHATACYAEFFADECEISLITGEGDVSDDDGALQTCLILVNGRDLATYSHGEQSRCIMALMIGMVRVISDITGEWIPPMWDEPTIAMDGELADEFFTGLSAIASKDTGLQYLMITRDDLPQKNFQASRIDLAG